MGKLHPAKVIGIMLILFGLPAISWYFMKSGADIRKAALEEMEVFSTLSDFELMTIDGKGLDLERIKGKVVISSFLPKDPKKQADCFQQLKWIQDQFMERLLKRDDFMFVSHVIADSLENLKQFGAVIENQKYKRWTLAGGSETVLAELGTNGYQLPVQEGQTIFDEGHLTIVDTDGAIRYYYNMYEKEDIAKLLIHLSLLLPQVDDRKVDIKTGADN